MRRFVFVFVALVCAAHLPPKAAFAQDQSALVGLVQSVKSGDWRKAQILAALLDQASGEKTAFRDHVAAAKAAKDGACGEAISRAQTATRAMPNFMQAYEPLAHCLVRTGRRADAARLYADLARTLPEGPSRAFAENRAARLAPDMRPTFSVSASIEPSTNSVRQTDEERIGFLTINEESRAAAGVRLGGDLTMSQPLFHRGHLSGLARLRFGLRYETVTDLLGPVVGLELPLIVNRGAGKPVLELAPYYEHAFSGTETTRRTVGLRSTISTSVGQKSSLQATIATAWNDFAVNNRDGYTVSAQLAFRHAVTDSDRLTVTLRGAHTQARIDTLTSTEVALDGEWEHRFENGFIPSLGATALLRQYEGNAPLSRERQRDVALSARIGLSHDNFRIGLIRPEIFAGMTHQWSNNPFYDHKAIDGGLRFKAAF